jgi:hypothetical protein
LEGKDTNLDKDKEDKDKEKKDFLESNNLQIKKKDLKVN